MRPRLRTALGAAVAAASAGAHASWQCTDAFDNHYVIERPVGETSGLQCEPVEDTPPAVAPEPSLPIPAPTPANTHRGGLVLAPPLRLAIAWPPAASRATAYDALIESVARATGQDADLLRAIVQVESHFDPDAVSAKGAIGLMQVMPATAAELGLAEPQRALFQPESNLRIGALYLRRLTGQFPGMLDLAIAAYNAGEGAVVRSGFAVPPYPETQGYVRDVLAIYRQLRGAAK